MKLEEIIRKLESVAYSDNQIGYVYELLKDKKEIQKEYIPRLEELYSEWVEFGNSWDRKYDSICKEIIERIEDGKSERS